MTVRPERAQGLGRGLAALIPQRPSSQQGVTDIPIARIRPNPYQPRQRMDEEELAALTASIVEHGVIQPILVSETLDGYELVAGQRRLRAAQAAGSDAEPRLPVRAVSLQTCSGSRPRRRASKAGIRPLPPWATTAERSATARPCFSQRSITP